MNDLGWTEELLGATRRRAKDDLPGIGGYFAGTCQINGMASAVVEGT